MQKPLKQHSARDACRSDTPYVALLRGINVGGKNKLSMADLVAIFERCGACDVRTYIQSGNVIFQASRKIAGGLAAAVQSAISLTSGLRVPILLRTAGDWKKLIDCNSYLQTGANPDHLHVLFLPQKPPAERATLLDPNRSPGDSFQLHGTEIYLHLPAGVADSKLTNAYFDRTLGTVCTARNWRTVLKINELLAEFH